MIRLFITILCILITRISFAQDKTTEALIKQIDYLQKRHEIIASNIANVSTPHYRAEDALKPDIISKKIIRLE
jgi:hypothetical protein